MLLYTIIFIVAIASAFGMLAFRAWEIKTMHINDPSLKHKVLPKLYFRHVEKIMLYLTKHIIQWIILVVVKYWFVLTTKSKKWSEKNLPKIYRLFQKEPVNTTEDKIKHSFVRRAVLESKTKIRHMKERVRRDHEKDRNIN